MHQFTLLTLAWEITKKKPNNNSLSVETFCFQFAWYFTAPEKTCANTNQQNIAETHFFPGWVSIGSRTRFQNIASVTENSIQKIVFSQLIDLYFFCGMQFLLLIA
jgi:hypothetical protein